MKQDRILVAVDDLYGKEARGLDPLRCAGYELVFNTLGRAMSKPELIAALDNVVATVAGGEIYDAEVFRAAPALRVIGRMGVGHDKIDLDAATAHGVAVAMAFGSNHDSVADYTMGMMLAIALSLREHEQALRAGTWQVPFHFGVRGRTLGLVGLGRIGRAVARRARAFNMAIIAHDPAVDPAQAELMGVELTTMNQVLRRCDFLSLHVPLTDATRNMVGADQFALMKRGAYLVSTARGGQIDEAALAEALRSGQLAGAALDVFAREPMPADDPLFRAENLLLSPHCSGMDQRGTEKMLDVTVENVLCALEDPASIGPNLINAVPD